MVCPLLGGLSSFGVSFIRGFTVHNYYSYSRMLSIACGGDRIAMDALLVPGGQFL